MPSPKGKTGKSLCHKKRGGKKKGFRKEKTRGNYAKKKPLNRSFRQRGKWLVKREVRKKAKEKGFPRGRDAKKEKSEERGQKRNPKRLRTRQQSKKCKKSSGQVGSHGRGKYELGGKPKRVGTKGSAVSGEKDKKRVYAEGQKKKTCSKKRG